MKTKQRKELLPGKKIAVDSNTFDAMTVEAKNPSTRSGV